MQPALSLRKAISIMLEHANPIHRVHYTHLFDLTGKILAQDLFCQKALPAFDNSGMDGYAVRLADLGQKTPILGTILAGESCSVGLHDGACYKVMTGAPIPLGTQAVIPFENATLKDDSTVLLPTDFKEGANIKIAGEELQVGAPLLQKGERLTHHHVALLASQGYSVLPTYAPLRIGVYSSGNELIEPWERAQSHQIYNSNASMLFSTLQNFGWRADYLGVLPDCLEGMREAIRGFDAYDVILTTGGVSQGEADFMERSLEEAGMTTLFHGIEVKPGRPTMMGILGKTTLLCLPGNPLSASINLHFLGIPMLKKMQGERRYHLEFVYAPNKERLILKGNRANMVLGRLHGGCFKATQEGKYGSGMLTPLTTSNAIIFCDKGVENLEEGALIKVIPYMTSFGEEAVDFFNI